MTLRKDDVARIERRNEFSLGRIERGHVIAVVAAVARRDAIQHMSRAGEKLRTKMVGVARLLIRELHGSTTVGGHPPEPIRGGRKHDGVVWPPRAATLVPSLGQVHRLCPPIA